MYLLDFRTRINQLFMFLGDKSEALRPDEKQHGGKKQVERLAKIRNPGNLKLQTPNRKLQFPVCGFP